MLRKIIPIASLSLVSLSVFAAGSSHSATSDQSGKLSSTYINHNVTAGQISPAVRGNGPVAAKPIVDEYIVLFNDDTQDDAIGAIGDTIEKAHGPADKPLHRYSLLKGFSGKIPPGQLKKLQADPQVKTIEVNVMFTQTAFTEQPSTVDSWGVDRLDQNQLPLDNRYQPFGDGTGVHAYVIDSGIRLSHTDFTGRAQWDFTASDINDGNDDGNGHGTHMAGTIGGATFGVARNVTLHAVKVMNNGGNGSLAGLMEGIEYVTLNHQSPAVATIGISSSFSAALNTAVAAASAAGVSFTVPSGDDIRDACLYSPSAIAGTSSPVIAVAATNSNDSASIYSNFGTCVDVYAPGLYIKSAWHSGDSSNNTISHSPIAAAHAAGAVALIRGNDPSCNVTQVKEKLLSNSHNDLLTGVPASSSNRLLAVATVADEGPKCDATSGEPPIVNVGYDHLVQTQINTPVSLPFIPANSTSTAEHGDFHWDQNTSSYVYTPRADWIGIDNFTYDNEQGTGPTVRVEVGLASNGSGINLGINQTYQTETRIAALSNGDTLLVWKQLASGRYNVHYQRFSPTGTALTNVAVASPSTRYQFNPSIVASPNGGFIITWYEYVGGDTTYTVFAMSFDGNNSPIVNRFTPGNLTDKQMDSEAASLSNGNTVFVWEDASHQQLKASLFTDQGQLVKAEFPLFADIAAIQSDVAVSAQADGGFIVAGLVGNKVMARQFDSNGLPLGASQLIDNQNIATVNRLFQIDLTRLNNGHHVVAWTETNGQDGSGYSPMARIIAADASPVSERIILNEYTDGIQQSVRVAPLSSGGFVAVWESEGSDGDGWGIASRQFDQNGNATSIEYRGSDVSTYNQNDPDVTVLADGRMAIATVDYSVINTAQARITLFTPSTENDDVLQGDSNDNILLGGGGDNIIHGGPGADLIYQATSGFGDEGDDTFLGGINLNGGAGNDIFYGGDTIDGGDGNDAIYGGRVIAGGAGADHIEPASGDSWINGGEGTDEVIFIGNIADYEITPTGNGAFTIVGSGTGAADGINMLTGVEIAEFADDRIVLASLADSPAEQTQRIQLELNGITAFTTIASISQPPSHGNLSWDSAEGAYVYRSETNYVGTDTFSYIDNQGTTVTVEVAVAWASNSPITVDINDKEQMLGSMAELTNGDIIVTWLDAYDNARDLLIQRFNSQGVKLTAAIAIAFNSGGMLNPKVTAKADGGYIVNMDDGYYSQAFHYNSENVWDGIRRIVSTQRRRNTDSTSMVLNNGTIANIWRNTTTNTIESALFSATHQVIKSDFAVFPSLADEPRHPTLVALPDGGYIIAALIGSGTTRQVWSQRFSQTGQALGGPVLVSTTTTDLSNDSQQIHLSPLGTDRYIVTWTATAGQDGSGNSVLGRILTTNGTAITDEFIVSATTANDQQSVRVVDLKNGRFIAVWQMRIYNATGPHWVIRGKVFNYDGLVQSMNNDIIMGDLSGSQQQEPNIMMLKNGQIVTLFSNQPPNYYRHIRLLFNMAGTSAADTLRGNDQDNILIGGEGYDTLYGGAGRDIFFDGNEIDGGAGSDGAYLSGKMSDYTVIHNGTGLDYTLFDKRLTSTAGTIHLVNVETVIFIDNYITLSQYYP